MSLLGFQKRVKPWRNEVVHASGIKRFDFDFQVAEPGAKKRKRKPPKVVLDFALHRFGVFPVVQNIVATFSLDTTLKLRSLVHLLRNVEYNPKKFPAIIMRRRNPKVTALIFTSGKVVVTGAKSEDESRLAARKVARCIQKLVPEVRYTGYHIENLVAKFEAPFAVDLNAITRYESPFASYEPELFPGLKYEMESPKCVCLVFVAGKVVITGLKCTQDIKEAFENIYEVLKSAKR